MYGSKHPASVRCRIDECHLTPGVVPKTAQYAGFTYGEWSARWWQWFWATATADSPTLDTTGALAGEGQSGPVWFLTWPLVQPTVGREITVPAGKALLFPATSVPSPLTVPPWLQGQG